MSSFPIPLLISRLFVGSRYFTSNSSSDSGSLRLRQHLLLNHDNLTDPSTTNASRSFGLFCEFFILKRLTDSSCFTKLVDHFTKSFKNNLKRNLLLRLKTSAVLSCSYQLLQVVLKSQRFFCTFYVISTYV